MSKIIYLCGPITGKSNGNFRLFERAERWYTNRGLLVHNPHSIAAMHPAGTPEREIVRHELAEIANNVDAIALLPGWQYSRYGLVEVAVGIASNITFIKGFSFDIVKPTLEIIAHGSNRSKTLAAEHDQPAERTDPAQEMPAKRAAYAECNGTPATTA